MKPKILFMHTTVRSLGVLHCLCIVEVLSVTLCENYINDNVKGQILQVSQKMSIFIDVLNFTRATCIRQVGSNLSTIHFK